MSTRPARADGFTHPCISSRAPNGWFAKAGRVFERATFFGRRRSTGNCDGRRRRRDRQECLLAPRGRSPSLRGDPKVVRSAGGVRLRDSGANRWTSREPHVCQALVRQLRHGERSLLLLASVSSSVVRRRGVKVANWANIGWCAFSFNGRAIGFFAAIRLRCCRTCMRKSSTFLPDLIAAVSHCGFNPRPAHVSAGLSGLRYLGATAPYPRALFDEFPPWKRPSFDSEDSSALRCSKTLEVRSIESHDACAWPFYRLHRGIQIQNHGPIFCSESRDACEFPCVRRH
jgi:hypothetical protein